MYYTCYCQSDDLPQSCLPVSSILGYAQCTHTTINVEGFHHRFWRGLDAIPKLLAKLVVWSSRSARICAAHSKVFARSIVRMGWRIGWRLNKSTIFRSPLRHLWGTDCWVGWMKFWHGGQSLAREVARRATCSSMLSTAWAARLGLLRLLWRIATAPRRCSTWARGPWTTRLESSALNTEMVPSAKKRSLPDARKLWKCVVT